MQDATSALPEGDSDPSPESGQEAEPEAADKQLDPNAPSVSQQIIEATHSAAAAALAYVTSTNATEPAAQADTPAPDSDGWVTVGSLKVKGGTYGTDYVYTEGAMQYRSADYTIAGTPVTNVVEVLTSKPLTFKDAVPVDPANEENGNYYSNTGIAVREGVHGDITFDGVHIWHITPVNIVTNAYDTESGAKATDGSQVRDRTSLHLTLADGSSNRLSGKTNYISPLHCGEGSDLTIDDSVRNVDASGNMVIPVGGIINEDVTLVGGKKLSKGEIHSVLDSPNPGFLKIYGVLDAASIGGNNCETGGRMTFNGGKVEGVYAPGDSCAAGIGGGSGGNGTDSLILFNGGDYTIAGGYHGAGVGAACYNGYSGSGIYEPDNIASRCYNNPTVAGDITIHGGYIRATGGGHGNGFGAACWSGAAGYNTGHTITVTGGTLYPVGSVGDLGGYNGYVVITGGSVYSGAGKFVGIGNTAWGNDAYKAEGYDTTMADDPNKVSMMTINLKSEIEKRNKEADPVITDTSYDELIDSWTLSIGGKTYEYGSPKQFFDGQLFLWLPSSAFSQEVTVTLKYTDKNGDQQTIEPLFRQPSGSQSGSVLKRYVAFELPENFRDMTKFYDGTPLAGLTIDDGENKIPTSDKKTLTLPEKVSYKYQRYSADQSTPLGAESAASSEMPADVGTMKLTVDSSEWSGDKEFSTNYWGHRATGWCEIKPIGSKVKIEKAVWPDDKPAADKDSAHKEITVQATIDKADEDPDGKPTGEACKAPRGFVQIHVDGKAVGDPVRLVFAGDLDKDGNEIKAGDARINAVEVPRGTGSYTRFTYSFIPADSDYLVPDATSDQKHILSLQFIPPVNDDEKSALYSTWPANYLESVNPKDDPDGEHTTEVDIDPVDPTTEVTLGEDPDADPDAPEDPDAPKPTVTTGKPEPADPNADPTRPGDKKVSGTISTVYDIPSEENPHPGRVTLNVKTSSSGPVSVTSEDGEVFEADFVRGEDGEPVRNPDGTYTLVLDPTAVGKGKLTFKQDPNGAHTGTTWSYDVDIQPNPKIRPQASVAKRAENLTHPDGPTQPGDRIRYTVTAANAAKGSAWTDVMLSDRLPAALELDESSVRLASTSEKFDGALKKAAAPTSVGTFALAGPDADGRVTISAFAGSVYGGSEAVLTFECTVAEDAVGADLANIAEVQGSRPDPDNPGGKLPENPGPSDPALPEGGGKVAPADPKAKTSKSVENTTAPDAKVTRVGDVLRYTVALANEGPANSCLVGAVISDPLPKGIEPVAGSIKMTLADGTEKAVSDGAFDKASRTLAVTAGDLWGGQAVTLVFDCAVGERALGENIANIALAHGKIPSENPGDGSQPKDPEPGEPTEPPSGEPAAFTPPATPPLLVGNDPADGDVTVEKEAENTSRDDGTTRVGDTVRYTIRLANKGATTEWLDTVLRDEVPKGLEPVAGTIKMTLPDGTEKEVSDDAYNDETRVLSVSAGRLFGGQEVVLVFDALVTEAAQGADIGNVAVALGTPPSAWDPDSEHPEAGEPFDPPEGWAAFEQVSDKVESNVAYPPGTDAKNGPLPAEGDGNGAAGGKKVDDSKTIAKTRLAQTGDDARGMAALGALAALAAGALALATRRRARSNR